jgi:hypothetical protein
MKLPLDWPRINQFPEWYTVTPTINYQVYDNGSGNAEYFPGLDMIDNGLPIKVSDTTDLIVTHRGPG